MVDEKMEFWVDKDIRRRQFSLTVVVGSTPGPFAIGLPIVFEKQDEDGARFRPTLEISFDYAEGLMTALWEAGVRPLGTGTSGELASVKYHLEDMRRLVFSDKREQQHEYS